MFLKRNKLLSLQGQFRKDKEEAIEMLHDRLVDKVGSHTTMGTVRRG